MGQYRKIMVVVDPAMKRSLALTRGVELAKKTGAALVLLLAEYNGALLRARFLDAELLHKAIEGYLGARRRWLEGEAAKLREEGLQVDAVVAWHKPAWEEVARQALALSPDLVIKDVESGPALPRTVFTPADWHLMRVCPVPLMLVNAHSSSYPQRVLAAIDPFDTHGKPGELNDRILQAALGMAYQCDAPVHVVHAYEYPTPTGLMGAEAVLVERYIDEAREEHREQFIAFGEAHGIPVDRMHLIEGSPARVIAQLAEDINADLVVLGTIGRRGLKRLVMGSTAEEILSGINSDVMVLKPPGFAKDAATELKKSAASSETE